MRLAMSLGHGDGLDPAVERLPELEDAGLEFGWVGESYGFDAATLLGNLAARSTRLQLGAGIFNVFSRPATLIAQTAATLDYVSGGRALVGLGTSGPQAIEGWFGVPYRRPVQRTRDVIEVCRAVWRRERVEHHGSFDIPLPAGAGSGAGKPLRLAARPLRADIPVWVAALGPRNVELTAEVAQGWLTLMFVPSRSAAVWGEALRAGLARRPVELGPFEIQAGGPVAIGEGLEHLRDLARPMVARYLGVMGSRTTNYYNDLACRYGFEAEAKRIQDLYLDGHRAEAEAAVPAELLEQTSLIGPAGYVKDRLAEYTEAGVTVLSVAPLGDPVATLDALRDWMP